MDRNALQQQVRQIVSDIMNVPVDKLASDPTSAGEWDSIQNLNVILAVEQATGVQFSPEEIEKMRNIDSIVQLVGSRQNKS
jgi:acyl carrier protein